MITVVNKHHHKEGEYIGRGSPLGNPFLISGGYPRESVIRDYKLYISLKINSKDREVCDELNRLYRIAKEVGHLELQCYCSPKACHGDVIKEILERELI